MSNHGWDGGCWVVLDRDCQPVSGYHHASEANAHAAALPVGFYVRRVACVCNQPVWEQSGGGFPPATTTEETNHG
ncbi:hypothetical protein N5079_19680 [Planotetraspora sp. A-T 1434]|uniref:hypothetical protein n=1 Tax=Planotetraspora sp. A-T 1434 TaxID=2979219 RepID=UPI0021BE2B74|nr:hypothetical protein [Planotetraspora sp. A-T 1434]MCT9932425.1 hypothetical protein [Planotetraspora sp. A-T 1434]